MAFSQIFGKQVIRFGMGLKEHGQEHILEYL
jgi:hypothetical protein